MRLLIVEDEPTLGELLRRNLTARGFTVDVATTCTEAMELLDLEAYDLVLLDRGLPDGDSLSLVPKIRRGESQAGILFLTARGESTDRVAGLDAGADDYIVKPFDMDELVARLRAVLRRPGKRLSTMLEVANLQFDGTLYRAQVSGQPLELSRQETALLELLMRHEGAVVRRAEIQRSLYSFDEVVTPNAVDAAISRLRKRLRGAGAAVEIAVLRGVGCMLEGKEP